MEQPVIGFHAIETYLSSPAQIQRILLSRKAGSRAAELADRAKSLGVQVHRVDPVQLDRYGDHRGIVLIASGSAGTTYQTLGECLEALKDVPDAMVLLLDGITDPQNLGAVLRSADQFRSDAVILPGRRSAQVNETVMKVSSGAAKYVPVITAGNLVQAIKTLQKEGFWVYAADLGGTPASKTNLTGRVAIVLGAEGKGVSRLVGEASDFTITIPSRGHIDSLNVSVAAGILLYEVRRQQQWN